MFRADIPPHVSETIQHLSPDLKRSIKASVRALCGNPNEGASLVKELEGLWKYRVSRFRIVYAIDRRRKVIRVMAVGHRRSVYEKMTVYLREIRKGKLSE